MCSDLVQQFNALVPSDLFTLDISDTLLPFYFDVHIPYEVQGKKVGQLEEIIEGLVELLAEGVLEEVGKVVKVRVVYQWVKS